VISISSDVLFPTSEQELLAAYIPNAKLEIIDSYYGHDGFLLEFETIENLVRDFMPPSPKGGYQNVTSISDDTINK